MKRARILGMAFVVAASFSVGEASAQRSAQTCVTASEEGQVAQKSGDLLRARERLLLCAAESCPAVVRTDCAVWMREVELALPSLVVSASDEDGHDVFEGTLEIDGKRSVESLSGKAIPLNPGRHAVRLIVPGHGPLDESVLLAEGEKSRVLHLRFPLRAAPATPPTERNPPKGEVKGSPGIPPVSIALFGGALLGVGGFATFGYLGSKEVDKLDASRCKPDCAVDDVSRARTFFLAADISLAVGIVCAGLGVWTLLRAPTRARTVVVTPGGLRGVF